MKFTKTLGAHGADTLLRAVDDGVYDGVPLINELLIESTFRNVTADMQVVAGALLFKEFVGHEVSTNGDVARQAAEAIGDYFSNRKVSVKGITDRPVAVWPSVGTLAVRCSDNIPKPPTKETSFSHTMSLLDSNFFSGAVSAVSESYISTTAPVFSKVNAAPLWRIALAVGVLASADLHVRTIALCEEDFGTISTEAEELLLRAINLNLIVV